ncbi:YkgJ family cysteine cluster protein [Clostridium omnivorum]|uniref:YkgJ family cysteine cluster protein n=1 Tax=Clostridium omnivorum TaxID=1604902 RepID=A0ABQ5N7J6_9CLOT|nr:YkgJ family cysteine cluster protein [Clostridium sp. E14]GLC31157.1 hypothetical protein bsdE14_25670 [Clostridium sp. E14]
MGRNDLCFCMSGKKNKNCHPNIHVESCAAVKLNIYGQLDKDLKEHRQGVNFNSLCTAGCSDCCYDYFTIQSIEFHLILNELTKWDKDKVNKLIERVERYWNTLEADQPEAIKLLLRATCKDIEEINSSVVRTSFPCVFLDEDTHLCQIYDYRPFKCRIFGTTYYCDQSQPPIGIACDKYNSVLNYNNFDTMLFDITELYKKNDGLSVIGICEYPLIYFLHQHFVVKKLGVSIVNFYENFKHPSSYVYNLIKSNIQR